MTKFCPKCGERLTDDAIFCTACGFKLDSEIVRESFEESNESDLNNDSVSFFQESNEDNEDNDSLSVEDVNRAMASHPISNGVDNSDSNYNSRPNKSDVPSRRSVNDINQYKSDNVKSKSESESKYKPTPVMTKQRENVIKLEKKFGVDLTNHPWFRCTLEELRETTFTNETVRDVNTAYVVIHDNYLIILKESVFIKSDMGHRKVYFENVTSIDYDKRGKFHLSNSVMINTKAGERAIQLKYVTEPNYNLLLSYFEKFMENKNKPTNDSTVSQVISPADELMKYAQLYKEGFLTKEEFEAKKKELL